MTDWNNKEEVLEAVRENGTKLENAMRKVTKTILKKYFNKQL